MDLLCCQYRTHYSPVENKCYVSGRLHFQSAFAYPPDMGRFCLMECGHKLSKVFKEIMKKGIETIKSFNGFRK